MEISVIKNKKQYKAYLKRMYAIMDAKKGSEEEKELDLLALVLEDYENKKFNIEAPDPIEAIKFILDQNGLGQGYIAEILKSKSRASEILNKKRKMSLTHIRVLTAALKIPTNTLIKDYDLAI